MRPSSARSWGPAHRRRGRRADLLHSLVSRLRAALPRCIAVSQRHSKGVLTRVGARCLQGGGRRLAALCTLVLSVGCAVDSLDRLGAGHSSVGLPGADAGPTLDGPLRPDSLPLDAGTATGPSLSEPTLLPLADAGSDVPSAGRELLSNPGFEQGHEGWFGLGESGILDVLEAHGGSRAILSTNRAASWEGPAYDIRSLVQPWRAYAVSAWVRNELDTQLVMLTLKGECNGVALQARLATRVVATDWLQLTSGFIAPDCAQGLQSLTLYVEGPPAFKNLLVDDVSLRQVTLSGEAQQATDAGSADGSGVKACVGNVSGNAASHGKPANNRSCNGNTGS